MKIFNVALLALAANFVKIVSSYCDASGVSCSSVDDDDDSRRLAGPGGGGGPGPGPGGGGGPGPGPGPGGADISLTSFDCIDGEQSPNLPGGTPPVNPAWAETGITTGVQFSCGITGGSDLTSITYEVYEDYDTTGCLGATPTFSGTLTGGSHTISIDSNWDSYSPTVDNSEGLAKVCIVYDGLIGTTSWNQKILKVDFTLYKDGSFQLGFDPIANTAEDGGDVFDTIGVVGVEGTSPQIATLFDFDVVATTGALVLDIVSIVCNEDAPDGDAATDYDLMSSFGYNDDSCDGTTQGCTVTATLPTSFFGPDPNSITCVGYAYLKLARRRLGGDDRALEETVEKEFDLELETVPMNADGASEYGVGMVMTMAIAGMGIAAL